MKHTEYIVPIGEDAQDYDEMFIGVIRRQPELVRCRDCKHWWKENALCTHPKTCCDDSVCCLECDADFYCGYAERKEE